MTGKTLEQFQKARSSVENQVFFTALLSMQGVSSFVASWHRNDVSAFDAILAGFVLAIVAVDAWSYRQLGPVPIAPRPPLEPEIAATAKQLGLKGRDGAGMVMFIGILAVGTMYSTISIAERGVDWVLIGGEVAVMALASLILFRLRQLGRPADQRTPSLQPAPERPWLISPSISAASRAPTPSGSPRPRRQTPAIR